MLGRISYVFAIDPEPGEFQTDSSENLTAWAWENYKNENYERAIHWAEICVMNYSGEARRQIEANGGLTEYPPGSVESVYKNFWALNDVGTCWLIIGEAWRHLGENPEAGSGSKAESAYKMLTDENKSRGEFYFAQCASDPAEGRQFLWKPANVAYARLIGYESEVVDNEGLIIAAWKELKEARDKARRLAELCVDMFSEHLPAEWAVNDVATCYFIIGEAWRMDNSPRDANSAYAQIVNNSALQGAKCIDLGPDNIFGSGDDFYWNVVEAAQDRLALAPNDVPTMPDIYPTPVK